MKRNSRIVLIFAHMDHPLQKLTRPEFGRLFPVIIAEPDPHWPEIFEEERMQIEAALGAGNIVRIEHIGSTAVPGLLAKPTIDILLEIPEGTANEKLIERLESTGYIYISSPGLPAPHMVFVKGYTIRGFEGQAYHLHIRYPGDWDELYFRDYLLRHPETVREYEALKQQLARDFPSDRDAYTDGKEAFIKEVTKKAREEKVKG